MANVIGAGAPCLASWTDHLGAARSPTIPVAAPSLPELPEAIHALLPRIFASLDQSRDGRSLGELRAALGVTSNELRLAIEAGLRARRIRRTGSHNTLRYLSNPHL